MFLGLGLARYTKPSLTGVYREGVTELLPLHLPQQSHIGIVSTLTITRFIVRYSDFHCPSGRYFVLPLINYPFKLVHRFSHHPIVYRCFDELALDNSNQQTESSQWQQRSPFRITSLTSTANCPNQGTPNRGLVWMMKDQKLVICFRVRESGVIAHAWSGERRVNPPRHHQVG